MQKITNTKNIRIALLAVPVAAAFALAGCSNNAGSADNGSNTPAQDGQQGESTQALGGGDDDQGGSAEDAKTAVATAEGEVAGSKAVDLDFDDNGRWDVDVYADGKVTELVISADGSSVESTEETDDPDDDDRKKYDTAELPLSEAIDKAVENTQGTIESVDLDDDDDNVQELHWSVEVRPEGSNDSQDVHVHAISGDVL